MRDLLRKRKRKELLCCKGYRFCRPSRRPTQMNTRPKHLPGPTVRTPRVATLFGVQYQCQYQYKAVFPRKHPSEIFNRLPPAPSRGSAPSATSSVAPSYAEHLGGLQGSADRTSSPRAKRPGKLKLGLGWEYLGIS